MKSVLSVFAVACLVGCGSNGTAPLFCNGALYTAIKLTVRNAQTGVSIASQATIIVTPQGGRSDTVVHPLDSVVLLGKLAGTYDVLVSALGFLDWTKQNVVVQGESGLVCQPIAVQLDAQLQPTP